MITAALPPRPPRGLLVSLAAALFTVALWALVLAPLTGCSASAVHVQAVTADTVGRVSNGALTVVLQVYKDQQLAAYHAACGNTTPCADPQAAREAVLAVRGKWAPVWGAWTLVGVAHGAWADQLDRCQGIQADAGEDAGNCGPALSELAFTLLKRMTALRCGLVGLGVDDPFTALGKVDCTKADEIENPFDADSGVQDGAL